MNKKLKLSIFCIVVCGLVGLMASPSAAVTVLWQAANTDIYLGLPFNDLEFENPLTGTEMVKEYAVLDWRDADYAAGPWYDDWAVSDPVNIDGNINEIWMRFAGHSIWTTTTAASNTVSIHLVGDGNDGLAEVLVDGVPVARLNMYTPGPPAETVLIIVKDLAKTTHSVTVRDQGASPGGPVGADDVATMGAAALEKRIKWKQPPRPAHPNNVFYGWNEPSDYNGHHIVADDWVCNTDDPVTDIHWWGSYIGWKIGEEPPVKPSSFHITIWTDVPDTDPGDPATFSHPGRVVHEIECFNFDSKFVGWDYDPRTDSYEACFKFVQILDETEYFFQELNTPGEAPNIYWISIAAKYPDTVDVEHPWGWKTRPRNSTSPAPDDAVRIFEPTAPHINDQYINGEPIEYPAGKSWDMAFELTARPIVPYTKWSQPPKKRSSTEQCYWGWDERSQFAMIPTLNPQIVADDWVCDTKDPVKDIHWWGSYIGWTEDMPPHVVPDQFHIGVWTDVPDPDPGNPQTFSHPRQMIWEWIVDRSEFIERYAGCDQHPKIPVPPGLETCFYYEYKIPESQWFYQEPSPDGTPTTYWLSISAMYAGVTDPQYPWGWKTRERDIDSMAPDDAVRIFNPTDPAPGALYMMGEPIWWPDETVSWDTAFELTSTRYGLSYVKWSQPPVRYDPPDAIYGWDEYSIYGNGRIVADDWFCDTDDPVSDIHWWGSFIGWSDKGQPPEIPDAFHIAIWTDVQPGPLDDFSHPGNVIWETVCREFTVEFAGWDFDPRQSIGTTPPRAPDACFRFDQDIPEDEWFRQKPGGNIYWVSIAAMYPSGTIPQYPWGWKVRPQNPDSRAPDDAVRIFDPCAPILYSPYLNGMPIYWPTVQDSWDTCFVLTTKPEPPKPPTEHLKWSQPPIEINPLKSRIPIYCGWDEESHNRDQDIAGGPWKIVADDFRCLGSMPITSIHWWGSYVNWMVPEPPPIMPESWVISFWSNVPADLSTEPGYSYPEKLLHQIKVDPDRVDIEYVGNDQFVERPPDSCFQYYVKLNSREYFWQADFETDTMDNVFWISIVAVYPDFFIPYPWGWKTRPWHWMDDAVTFNLPDHPLPGFSIPDPFSIKPIEDALVCGYMESYDVAFELDTDPCYIKWEQPFTSLRHWPHYEDELSMAIESADGTINYNRAVADDWPCLRKTPVTAVVWWGSYIGYGYEACKCAPAVAAPPQKPDYFLLTIWNDTPADADPGVPFSHPNEPLWKYRAFDYDEVLVGFDKHPHGEPNEPVFRYSVRLPQTAWFLQKKAKDIYWLSVVAVYKEPPRYPWGWTNHEHVFHDDAVAGYIDPPAPNWTWKELYDQTGKSQDMSFVLFTEPGCFPAAHPDYYEWLAVGKPSCWCYPRQCHGDADNLPYGKKNYWTALPDLEVLKAAWNMPLAAIQGKTVIDYDAACIFSCNVPLICADFDHKPYGKFNYRVALPDLAILKTHWNIPDKPDPNCFAGY